LKIFIEIGDTGTTPCHSWPALRGVESAQYLLPLMLLLSVMAQKSLLCFAQPDDRRRFRKVEEPCTANDAASSFK
jgi:hypothetical protein